MPNPRLELSQEDYEAQFSFINEVNETVSEAHQTIIDIRKLKKQMSAYKEIASDQPEIISEIERIDSLLTGVETNLYQTKNESRQDPLNFPIQLTNKLAHLNSLTSISDFPPTSQAVALKQELEQKIWHELDSYDHLIESEIPELNRMIKLGQVDAIKVPAKVDKP